MKHALFITLLISMLAGCQTAPPPAAGMATLRVQVIAEPKTGVVTANTHVLSYDAPAARTKGQFEKVDYASLDEIVVWLEPVGRPTSNPSKASAVPLSVDAAKPSTDLSVAGVGEIVTFHNSGSNTINLYSVSDGNSFDLGSIPPGGHGVYVVKSAGLIEVLTDSLKDPITQVYAAPSPWVRITHAGETVEFENLPPGKYKIISWHPRLPGREVSITLPVNQTTSASIKVGVNDLPKIDAR
jgi:hypothetical protein